MRPDWKRIEVGDVAYQPGVIAFWCDAYGISDMRDMPTAAPDDRPLPGDGWQVRREPADANVIGSRFIAVRQD